MSARKSNRGSVTILFIPCIVYYFLSLDLSLPDEFYYKTGDFIKRNGYGYEEYSIESVDGFITKIFRIVSNVTLRKDQVPVIVESGLFGSSDLMTINSQDIPYLLAREGFDVWLGNYRGARYSAPGPSANFSDPNLLNYGLHEQGFDFAATIDFIRNKTGHDQVDITVTSAGTVNLLSLQASQPEYNAKIRKALHFGPGITLKLSNWFQRFFFTAMLEYSWAFTATGFLEWFPAKPKLMSFFCVESFFAPLCHHGLHRVVGPPTDHVNPYEYALLLSLFPSGAPIGTVHHLLQFVRGGEFRQRDFGETENLLRYNSSVAPLYKVDGITTFTKIYTAKEDVTVYYELARNVFNQMPNFAGEFIIEPPFHHCNFAIHGNRSPKFVEDVIRTLSSR